jgi:hypothetical protein
MAILNGSVKKIFILIGYGFASNLIIILKSVAGMIQALNDHFYIY